MNFAILLMTAYHITLLQESQVSVANYLISLAFILGVSIILTFLIGIIVTKFEIERDMVWFLFNGFNFSDYCGNPGRYILGNMCRFIFYMGAVLSLFYIAPKII